MIDKEQIIIECLNKEYDGIISKDMKLIEDLGLNSLQLITILFDLEEKGLSFKRGFYKCIDTVNDLINNTEVNDEHNNE